MSSDEFRKLQSKLGYEFKAVSLLETALTHSSFANENKKSGIVSNERLEFLGDSVLGMTVAEMIYSTEKNMPEGQMTKLRAELICERNLAAIAERLDLGACLYLGKGEEKSGGRHRASIMADAVEAVIAAMYLDGGISAVFDFVMKNFANDIDLREIEVTDYKTVLQEIFQEEHGQVPQYHIAKEQGPDHKKVFTVQVSFHGTVIGIGLGSSKKQAEQNSAKAALEAMKR
jgi:ribonuclease-3